MDKGEFEGYDLSGLNVTQQDERMPGYIVKSLAFSVDLMIAVLLRVVIIYVLSNIFLSGRVSLFHSSFIARFGVSPSIIASTAGFKAEHVKFFLADPFAMYLTLCLLVSFAIGGMYYVISFSSKTGMTLGCKIFKIKLVHSVTMERVSFLQSLSRYLLSLIPWILPLAILPGMINTQSNIPMIILSLIWIAWYQIAMFNKKRQALHEILSRTTFVFTKK